MSWNAWTRVLGTVPGGGNGLGFGISDTEKKYHDLGMKVVAYDSSGYRGEWVYCKAGEALAAKAPLSPYAQSYGTTVTPDLVHTVVEETTVLSIPAGRVPICGVAEQAVTSGNYFWLRTSGYVADAPWAENGTAGGTGAPLHLCGGGSDQDGKWVRLEQAGLESEASAILMNFTNSDGSSTTANIYLTCRVY